MLRTAALFALTLVASFVLGCSPTYPNCNNDEDCNKEKPRGEFCVNQTCQQCRSDKNCATGKYCNKGRCDGIAGYCESDGTCPLGTACIENRCTPCKADAQCGEGGKCKSGKCLRKGQCDSDDDCPQDQDCVKGTCSSVGPKRASQEAPCKLAPVYFDFNESALSTDATDAIDRNAKCLQLVGRTAQLVGRTDERGTVEYNLVLSERRAMAVKDRLIRLGVSGDKMRTLPKGELEATGHDEAGWANDRRVDFEWM